MQIWELFEGYDKAHGVYEIRRSNDKGKLEGQARTLKEPLTPAKWDAHVAGTGPGIGVIPLRSDDTMVWGCIDIDVIGIDLKDLERRCKNMKLPLVICRSKSGGAHAFLFLKEPIHAKLGMDVLASWSAALGYGGCEVFPKQSGRYDEVKDIGNWLNMPYYDADNTLRYCIIDGEQVELREFLEYAESMQVTESELEAVPPASADLNEDGSMFEEGPPCLQIIQKNGGFPDGTRNEGMYNVAVYLRKRHPDDWADKMQAYNVEMCDPPLPLSDINTIVKSGSRKEYEYKCRKPPIAAYCDRRACLSRACGVGEGYDGAERPDIMNLRKYVSDPVLWYFEINDRTFQMTTAELLNQNMFAHRVSEVLNRIPNPMPQPRWLRYLNEKFQNVQEIMVPIEASSIGQFHQVLDSYLMGKGRCTTKEQLATSNAPYITGDGEVWFKIRGLIKYLETHGYKYKSEHHVFQMLRDEPIYASTRQVNAKGRNFNVWVVREPAGMEEEKTPSFGTQEF